jgi:restriction system protein
MKEMKIPKYFELMNPLIEALNALGGSGTNEEIYEKVVELEKFSEEILSVLHKGGPKTELEYRLRWAQTYLKKYGVLENSTRGVWAFSQSKKKFTTVDPREVVRLAGYPSDKKNKKIDDNIVIKSELKLEDSFDWKEELMALLYSMPSDQFERLTQRVLRESGLHQVEVTGKTGDGGIDGKGIFKIAGLIGFNILFQCKRWKNSVTSKEIRDFRGAMQGRADKGLFVTTGAFTRDAIKEASRDGAIQIDLMDGDALTNKIRELKLGISIKKIEKVEINSEFFESI